MAKSGHNAFSSKLVFDLHKAAGLVQTSGLRRIIEVASSNIYLQMFGRFQIIQKIKSADNQ